MFDMSETPPSEPNTPLKKPVNLRDLIEDGAVLEIETNTENDIEEDKEALDEYRRNMADHLNLEVLGLEDEDLYVEGQPFEQISSKMEPIHKKIKKRIIRQGYGNKPQDLAIVRVHYNAYMEFMSEPFDSTYARKKPHQFSINNGDVIIGMDLAVRSMILNEKAQFLIEPEFAYGCLGCLNRVPPNSVILFEIELLEIVDAGKATSFQFLPEEQQKKFLHVYDFCIALCNKGKDLFSRNVRGAIKEYNTAVSKLEMAQCSDYDDQVKQQELLLRLYTNLLVCYTKVEEPKKGCTNFNKIMDLTKGTNINVQAKCFFNNAKCLRMLGEFELAKVRLNKALALEPKNSNILEEAVLLEQKFGQYKVKQLELAKALIKN